ncbi:MAG TPA: hypothetical protein VG818_02415 [Gemmatimonadaceae bacterium]|jgi:hypothetical protein|nr:hypothetical protein [Gemmatimonadaceae bacterium]
MSKSARILTALAALLLLTLYIVPIWRISLLAPQYPEGLGMQIHVNTVTGVEAHDLDNINELNHYIGMKVIEPSSIAVLRIMPWVVGILAVAGLLVAAIGKRGPLYAWLGSFAGLGVAGLVVFWYWEYDYGHHLDEARAIIKVPGMTYQPPLLGSRQILNFTATSMPDIGGWLAGIAFLLGVVAVVMAVKAATSVPVEPRRS